MSDVVITVTINPDGSTELSVNGLAGKGCLKLTESLERALGADAGAPRTMTREAAQAPLAIAQGQRGRA